MEESKEVLSGLLVAKPSLNIRSRRNQHLDNEVAASPAKIYV